MLSHLTDRREKPEGEHLEHLVKTRFNDADFEDFEREAEMFFDGKLAPTVREYALIGKRVAQQRRESLVKRLANGEAPRDEERVELARWLAYMAEQSLLSPSIDTTETA